MDSHARQSRERSRLEPGAAGVVFVVDDEPDVRAALENLLSSAGFLVRAFSSAHDFLGSARVDSPACLILDVLLPHLNGLELQTQLAAHGALLPIIFLTGVGDIPMTVRAMKAGATGFFTKPFEPAELLDAVGGALAQSREAHTRLGELRELQRRYATLTARERAVMDEVIVGKLNKQIAHDFGTKETTVKEQRAKMMEKMQVSSVAELVQVAVRLRAL
jgi:FixJ family two-component response regulator